MIDKNLPLDHQYLNDPGNNIPDVILDEDGNPVDEIDDEDMFDYKDER